MSVGSICRNDGCTSILILIELCVVLGFLFHFSNAVHLDHIQNYLNNSTYASSRILVDTTPFETKHEIPNGRPPHFYIIGAPKCATTSLYRLFTSQHGSVCHSTKKEIHYFDRPDSFARGARYYLGHFRKPEKRSDKCRYFFDSTPDYLANSLAAQRMYNSLSSNDRPRKKFIVILRDPVMRAYSWYNHRARMCVRQMNSYLRQQQQRRRSAPKEGWDMEKLCGEKHCIPMQCKTKGKFAKVGRELRYLANFTEYYQAGGIKIAKNGYYLHQLQNWLSYFDESQFFIVNLSTLLQNTTDTVLRMTNFLDLPVTKWRQSGTSISRPLQASSSSGTGNSSTTGTINTRILVTDIQGSAPSTTSSRTTSTSTSASVSASASASNRASTSKTSVRTLSLTLPHENTARVDTKFDCAVRNALYPIYEQTNRELYAYLQQKQDRKASVMVQDNQTGGTRNIGRILAAPTYEPPFPPFDLRTCGEGQIY
mmetsp:Transcript_32170/g.54251  ORF Transcript_32170/g.54251 Transcript_32170/m.54251 type:complete len:482 (-) Transcript_32170:244-1689(-)